MKTSTGVTLAIIAVVAVVAGFLLAIYGGQASVASDTPTGLVVSETGETTGAWAGKIVNYKLLVSDLYTGSDVSATAKVYDEKPADWGNPRGDFSDASKYTTYSASSGAITVNKEVPAKYYAVITASGYNTEFFEFTIPDGSGRTEDLPDYQSNPDTKAVEMTLVGSTTDKDFAITLVNDTSAEVTDTVLLKVAENTQLRGWKAVVTDTEGFSTDADNDGIYDEGISMYKVSIAGIEEVVFDPNNGIDEFNTEDKFTIPLDDLVVGSQGNVIIDIEIDAVTEDGTSVTANDEKWSEGEGVLSYIYIYDDEGNLFSTTDVTA